RLHRGDLGAQPAIAGVDLPLSRRLVNAPLAARLPLEVLDRIGDVHLLARNASLVERAIQQCAGWTDEGMALLVFLVAWLLAHEHQGGGRVMFTEYRSGGYVPEGKSPASLGFCA